MTYDKKFLNLFFVFLFMIFLIGCQQAQEVSEQEPNIEIIDENINRIDEELEKEFDDGLDEALKELEEVENI